MTNKLATTFLQQNSRYVDESDAVSIEQIPDEAWPAVLEALDELSGGATDPGIDCKVTITHETLADFDESSRKSWNESGYRSGHEFNGLKAVKYERLQRARGEPRRDMIVVDLGEKRIALY